MQRLKRCLGVDIGGSSVKVVELAAEKAGVRVVKVASADLGFAPGPMDSDRINAIAKTIKELVSRNKISTKHPAVFCVPGQSVFIRRIKVPRTTEERLYRIVAYEACQQIPFALDNSLMEYQVFDTGTGGEIEVLLVAIKKDLVLDFMKVVNKTGLRPVAISVSSLALFNFHVFDATPFDELQRQLAPKKKAEGADTPAAEGEAAAAPAAKKKGGFDLGSLFGKKKKSAAAAAAAAAVAEDDGDFGGGLGDAEFNEDYFEEVRAFINLGAQTFDLAIGRFAAKRKMLGFTRSVPMAGNELSRSLQEKLGLDSLASAEQIKREQAVIIVPGREDEASINPEASEFATTWADRVILDLRKSFDFYISQPDGFAVDSIYMSGGQSRLRNLRDYVEDKLGIPVTLKEEPDSQAMILGGANSADRDGGMAPYLIALGLGLTGLGLGRITVDFLPTELKTIREFKKKNIPLILMGAAIAGMLGLSTLVGEQKKADMNRWLEENQSKIDVQQRFMQEFEAAKAAREAVNSRISSIGSAVGDRTFWIEFLGIVESCKPSDVVILSIAMNPEGTVDIIAETESLGSVSAFAQALRDQKEWVESVNITNPPQTAFSALIGKQVSRFGLRAEAQWKKTRLAPARVTLPPGQLTPTPAPTQGGQMGTFGGQGGMQVI